MHACVHYIGARVYVYTGVVYLVKVFVMNSLFDLPALAEATGLVCMFAVGFYMHVCMYACSIVNVC
jgi:hypothetical protein